MKRFCVVFVCLVFCFPLLLIPSFADNVLESDSSSLRSSSSVLCVLSPLQSNNAIASVTLDGVVIASFSSSDDVRSYSFPLDVGSVHSLSVDIYQRTNVLHSELFYSNLSLPSAASSRTLIPYSDSFDIKYNLSHDSASYYFEVCPEGSVPFVINAPGVFPAGAYIVSGVLNGVEIYSYSVEDAVRSVSFYVFPGTPYTFVGTFYNQSIYYMTLSYDGHWVSNNSAFPTSLSYSDSYSLSFVGYNTSQTNYFTIESPPFTNVIGSGVSVVIDSFGDVIDYVVNTPSVAVFVALSVSVALIPLGIIAVKKVIKGY